MSDAGRRMRILFVTSRHPLPPNRGDRLRNYYLVKGLARHADVTLVCFGGESTSPIDGVRLRAVPLGGLSGVLENLRHPRPDLPMQVRLYLQSGMRRVVDEEVRRDPDVVHVHFSRMAPYMPGPGPFHRHLDFMDSLSLNMVTRARASSAIAGLPFAAEARLLRRYEARMAAAADTHSLVSAADLAATRGLEGAAIVQNGVDMEAFPFRDPADRDPSLIFFGNLGYFHNIAPAVFVATKVLPLVRRRVPGTTLRIVGARPAAAVRRLHDLEGVEVVAEVPSMSAEIQRASVSVLPQFSGSGLKNKVLEAFATGSPVVANALGMQGVEGARPGREYLAAEGARQIAAAAVGLLGDVGERRRLARSARALVEARYSWERQVEALLDLYRTSA
jgi:glycosyltransferase involved in cell wall biosynthesis